MTTLEGGDQTVYLYNPNNKPFQDTWGWWFLLGIELQNSSNDVDVSCYVPVL